MSTERRIPASRLGRISRLGHLAGGIASGLVAEGARQVVQGKRPRLSEILLTPSNARRLRDRMSEMRGAAMKVGQLLSMDSGNLLPPEFSEVLKSLRESAHHMPAGQMAGVLDDAWGENWHKHFKRFQVQPVAAASIGQVHEAMLADGRRLAVKIQYPGVKQSIDSDVANVAGLLKLFKLIPDGIDLDVILEEAKLQLHDEADYLREADSLRQYKGLVAEDQRFVMPEVIDELTTSSVLAMSYLDGQPVETVAELPEHDRNRVATDLLELLALELFDWGLVQTDPNFANYRYQHDSGKIELLDFGATRVYSEPRRHAIRQLLAACMSGESSDIRAAAVAMGYLGQDDPPGYEQAIMQLLITATSPARQQGDYDFASTDIADRVSDIVVNMRLNEKYGRLPPVEVLFLHRKIGGLYLLLNRLQASVPVNRVISGILSRPATAVLDASDT